MANTGRLDQLLTQWNTDPDYLVKSCISAMTERISEIMNRRDISRAELARRLGKDRSYVTQLLDGRNVTLKTLVQVAVALDECFDVTIPSSVQGRDLMRI